jgi:hypothetical protein
MAAAEVSPACRWCQKLFKPQRGGSPKAFCGAACRSDFHTAARRWAERALIAGRLTIADLRNGTKGACTLPRRTKLPAPRPDIAPPDPALLSALRVRGSMMLRLPIAPEGIAGLVQAGWLAPRDCRDATAVADAVVDACDAALDAHLQPKQT